MSLAITVNFLESSFQLDKKTKKYTMDAISQLENNPDNYALRCHRINKMKCDPSFWSARVNDDIRIIFSMEGDLKTLLYVDHHEEAYHWCEGKYLRKTNFGAKMIYDENLMLHAEEKLAAPVFFGPTETPLLEGRGIKKKQLLKLGIEEVQADHLLQIADEDIFLDYIQVFPQELQEALLSLETGDRTYDEVYLDLQDEDFQSGKTTEQKDTKRRIHLLQNLEELESILNNDDFERWEIFLHPTQEKLVRRHYRGPALVEGGPGTGKTVVGMHRALYLATEVFPKGRVLICTFSRKLALSIEEKMSALKTSKNVVAHNISVMGIDAYILSLYRQAYGKMIEISLDSDIRKMISGLFFASPPVSGSLDFYLYEYKEVVERLHVRTLEEYIACDRSGSGGPPLTESQRRKAWLFLEKIIQEKEKQKLISFVDLAYAVLKAFDQDLIKRKYDSIVIDEAQDLEPVKLCVLEKSAIAAEDNLFILSDLNQRVFRLNSWKKDTQIQVVGRTYYLNVNYRTTKQISDYARDQFISSKIISSHIRDYKSIMNGVPPVIEGFASMQEQQQYVIEQIQKLSEQIPPEQICVVCPRQNDCTHLAGAFEYVGVKYLILEKDKLPGKGTGVNLCTIRGVKGLEFRVIILYNYQDVEKRCMEEAGNFNFVLPQFQKMSECEKYVAITRARDELYLTYLREGDKEE